MEADLSVLLVHDGEESWEALTQTLANQGIATQCAHTCSEVSAALEGACPPTLVLTDTSLADGTWADVLRLAHRGDLAVPVIVVSRLVDIEFYIKTLESGAADFIVPPISSPDLFHVVKAAIGRSHPNNPVKAHQAAA